MAVRTDVGAPACARVVHGPDLTDHRAARDEPRCGCFVFGLGERRQFLVSIESSSRAADEPVDDPVAVPTAIYNGLRHPIAEAALPESTEEAIRLALLAGTPLPQHVIGVARCIHFDLADSSIGVVFQFLTAAGIGELWVELAFDARRGGQTV